MCDTRLEKRSGMIKLLLAYAVILYRYHISALSIDYWHVKRVICIAAR